jgi:hypothetical protein
LWHYYTAERPPLWIIPAWPIASLSIDRITRLFKWGTGLLNGSKAEIHISTSFFKWVYWTIFIGFFGLMLNFVAPTFTKLYTILSLLLCVVLIATPIDYRYAVFTFLAGTGLGYFLELWGTTRQCWTYYTFQTPPLFAVLAHGMAAIAFWRAGRWIGLAWGKLISRYLNKAVKAKNPELDPPNA